MKKHIALLVTFFSVFGIVNAGNPDILSTDSETLRLAATVMVKNPVQQPFMVAAKETSYVANCTPQFDAQGAVTNVLLHVNTVNEGLFMTIKDQTDPNNTIVDLTQHTIFSLDSVQTDYCTIQVPNVVVQTQEMTLNHRSGIVSLNIE